MGSISMKLDSSNASKEALKEPFGLSKDSFRFTNQLYEKLSIESDSEVSMEDMKELRSSGNVYQIPCGVRTYMYI